MSSGFYASYIALWILFSVIALLVVLLYRHFGLIAMGTIEGVQRDGLAVGSQVPAIRGTLSDATDISWEQGENAAFLIFAAPTCEPCAAVLPLIRNLAVSPSVRERVEFIAVVEGMHQSVESLKEKFDLPFSCLAEAAYGAFSDYRVRVTPFAFVIGEDGRVRSKGLCNNSARLKALFETAGLVEIAGLIQEDQPDAGRIEPVPTEVAV